MADKKIRSIAKTFSWRFFIFIYWMIFAIFTQDILLVLVYWAWVQLFLSFSITFMKEFGIKLNGVLIKLFNYNYKYFSSLSD